MRTKSRLVTALLMFLSITFPILGHIDTVLAQAPGNISGVVLGVDGRPLMGVEVQLIDISTGNVVASTKTAKDGSFSFDRLKAGKTYNVKAFHGTDVNSALVTASTAPSKPVALKLSRTKGVKLLAAAKGGLPTWAYVLIGVGVVGAAVGGAAAAGAFEGGRHHRPASPASP